MGGLLAVALFGGCAGAASTSLERATSFQSLAGRQVAGQPLREFVTRRTALLIGGMPADAEAALPLDSMAHVMKAVHGRFAIGTTTAVDVRGYFLTAAHCVDWQPLHVARMAAGRVRLSPARVVWRGNAAKEGSDLAVLAIDERVEEVFSWAPEAKDGDPVVGVGPDYDDPANFRLGCFSGLALRHEMHSSAAPAGKTIYHSSPVHLGDSGGPLTTTDGWLIGVNVGDVHEYDLLRLKHQQAARAHRPNLDWLKNLLERDFASRPRP